MNNLENTLRAYLDEKQVQQVIQGIQIGLPIVIYGVHMPTGKTTLCKNLLELGVNAKEAWEKEDSNSNDVYITITLNQRIKR